MPDAPTTRRSSHQTQWAAQFAVASELCKEGYEVALTMGNHPTVDIMVRSPLGVRFDVDVKGLYKRNFWLVNPKPPQLNMFYVFAFVAPRTPNSFFVLPQELVNRGIRENIEKTRKSKTAQGLPYDEAKDMKGNTWQFAEENSVGWAGLPK